MIAVATKRCTKCGVTKPLDDFHRGQHADGRRSRCKEYCTNWDKEHKRQKRNERLRYSFGITVDDYETQLKRQGNRCAICGTVDPGGCGEFHVDHSHQTGHLRGLLCMRCNQALGLLNDDPKRTQAATEYLSRQGVWVK